MYVKRDLECVKRDLECVAKESHGVSRGKCNVF